MKIRDKCTGEAVGSAPISRAKKNSHRNMVIFYSMECVWRCGIIFFMFNIRRFGYLFLLVLSALASFQYLKIIFYILRDVFSGKGADILLLAWPIMLLQVLLTIFFVFLTIFSWKKLQKIDAQKKTVSL